MSANKFLILSFASIISLGICVDNANAGWSKSGTTTTSKSYSFSKSYSYSKPAKSGWSVTSPKNTGISGFGNKPSGYNRPIPSSLNSNSNKSFFEKKQNAIASTSALSSISNKSNNTSINSNTSKPYENKQRTTVINNTTVVKKKYYYGSSHTPVYYSVPSYYTPTHDHYGMISGMFLGMMLSHALEPSYYNWAYSHYNDPNYLAWHQDMENQAQNNYELRQQLNQLDNKVDELKAENAAKTDNLPDDVNQDQVNYHDDSTPDAPQNSNSSRTMIYIASFLVCILVFVAVVAIAL